MWALFSTKEFNETANERIPLRKDSWESYKSTVAAGAANPSLIPDNNSGHVVIIIGYNEETNEIAFSDSWGSGTRSVGSRCRRPNRSRKSDFM